MTDYKIAEEIANEIVKILNEKYEAHKEKNMKLCERLLNWDESLEESLDKMGYEIRFVFDETAPRIIFGGRVSLRVESANVYKIYTDNEADDDYKCTVGYMQDLCDRG